MLLLQLPLSGCGVICLAWFREGCTRLHINYTFNKDLSGSECVQRALGKLLGRKMKAECEQASFFLPSLWYWPQPAEIFLWLWSQYLWKANLCQCALAEMSPSLVFSQWKAIQTSWCALSGFPQEQLLFTSAFSEQQDELAGTEHNTTRFHLAPKLVCL